MNGEKNTLVLHNRTVFADCVFAFCIRFFCLLLLFCFPARGQCKMQGIRD